MVEGVLLRPFNSLTTKQPSCIILFLISLSTTSHVDDILLPLAQQKEANFLSALVLEEGGYGFKFRRDLYHFRRDDAYEISNNRCLRRVSRSWERSAFRIYNHRRVCHLRSSFLILHAKISNVGALMYSCDVHIIFMYTCHFDEIQWRLQIQSSSVNFAFLLTVTIIQIEK